MFKLFIVMTKITVVFIWLAFIFALLSLFPDNYNSIFLILGVLLFIIHLLEYIVMKKMTDKRINFFQTMLFGYGHWLPLFKTKRAQ